MTISGKKVYESIRTRIRAAENEQEGLSRELSAYEQGISTLTDQREQYFARLAMFYLPELDAAAVKNTLKELQDDVKNIFNERQQRRAQLDKLLSQSREKKAGLEEKLATADRQLEETVTQREQLKKALAEELAANPLYQNLHGHAGQAQTRLEQNKKRHETFTIQATQKLAAYTQEPLFDYLLRRNFGVGNYGDLAITTKLDTWVAGKVNYKETKANYDFLKLMPEAIKAEIDRQQNELDLVVENMRMMETKAAEQRGLPPVLSQGKHLIEQRKKILTSLEKEDQEFCGYAQERTEADNAKGEYYQTALGKLKGYLKGNTVSQLKQRAKTTPSTEDDGLVDKIEQVDVEIKEIKAKAKGIQQQQSALTTKLDGLQRISRFYTSKDYESNRSYFDSGFNVDTFLLGYLGGQYSLEAVTGQIDSHQKFKPRETYSSYSSQSYSSRDDDSSHHHSSGSSSSSSDSGSGFGGGGFDSGGGFGGGGFSSGDGF